MHAQALKPGEEGRLCGRIKRVARLRRIVLLAVAFQGLVVPGADAWTQAEKKRDTGWVCGTVRDETASLIAEAAVTLYPRGEAPTEKTAVAQVTSGPHGKFCLRDLAPGFYELHVSREPWPPQPSRTVEVRAGLVNRLTPPIELEREPGAPHVSYEESFDGMPPGEARAVMERLLRQGDTASIQEVARRLLPKRGVAIDLNRLVLGLDVKPLVDELLRQFDQGYLPPLKTARYVYVVSELADPRTPEVVMPALLRRLGDARSLPPDPASRFGESEGTIYVSDIAIHAVARFSGKDFNWKYGQPPWQNQRAIANARDWWRREVDKQSEKRR